MSKRKQPEIPLELRFQRWAFDRDNFGGEMATIGNKIVSPESAQAYLGDKSLSGLFRRRYARLRVILIDCRFLREMGVEG